MYKQRDSSKEKGLSLGHTEGNGKAGRGIKKDCMTSIKQVLLTTPVKFAKKRKDPFHAGEKVFPVFNLGAFNEKKMKYGGALRCKEKRAVKVRFLVHSQVGLQGKGTRRRL